MSNDSSQDAVVAAYLRLSPWQRQMLAYTQEFQTAATELQRLLSPHQPYPPDRLYHYTNMAGLQGILELGGFWLSDVRFLNDSSELAYGMALIEEVIAEASAEEPDELITSRIDVRSAYQFALQLGPQPFVACFCEEGDLLSQWRGYAAGEAGVSLGLRFHHALDPGDSPLALRKVIYDEAVQREVSRLAVSHWFATTRRLLAPRADQVKDSTDALLQSARSALATAVADLAVSFKSPVFEEEKEWRLVRPVHIAAEFEQAEEIRARARWDAHRESLEQLGRDLPAFEPAMPFRIGTPEGLLIRFRASKLGLIPYVEVPIRQRAGNLTGKLPLHELRLGPAAHQESTLTSIRIFLASHGISNVEVQASGIPLRT